MKQYLILFLFPALAFAQTGEGNLLQNGAFESGGERRATRWLVPPTPVKNLGEDAAKIDWGVKKDADENGFLFITTKEPLKLHLWWQQEVAALGGATYELSLRMAAEITGSSGGTYATPDVGLYFLNAEGRWIGYQRLPAPKQFSPEWTEVSMKVTAPDETVKIGVRLGVSTSAELSVRFDDAVLRQAP
jgi:hypothetical protein